MALFQDLRSAVRKFAQRPGSAITAVTAEIALSLVLLIATTLLLRSFAQFYRVTPGVRIEVSTPEARAKISAFLSPVQDRMNALPGVKSAALVGVIGALVTSQPLKSMLFGVSAADSGTFVLIPALLLAVAVFACYMPARRASRIDPTVALRAE